MPMKPKFMEQFPKNDNSPDPCHADENMSEASNLSKHLLNFPAKMALTKHLKKLETCFKVNKTKPKKKTLYEYT